MTEAGSPLHTDPAQQFGGTFGAGKYPVALTGRHAGVVVDVAVVCEDDLSVSLSQVLGSPHP